MVTALQLGPSLLQRSHMHDVLVEAHEVLHLRPCLHVNQPGPARNEGRPGVREPMFQFSHLPCGTNLKQDFILKNIDSGCLFHLSEIDVLYPIFSFLSCLAVTLSSCCSLNIPTVHTQVFSSCCASEGCHFDIHLPQLQELWLRMCVTSVHPRGSQEIIMLTWPPFCRGRYLRTQKTFPDLNQVIWNRDATISCNAAYLSMQRTVFH